MRVHKPRGTTYYHFEFQFNNEQQRGSCRTKNKQDAEVIANEVRRKLLMGQTGLLPPEQAPTFKDKMNDWFDLYAVVECEDQTQGLYRQVIDQHLIPAFGNRRINQITREDVARFIAKKLTTGLSKSTVKNIIAPMRKMF